MKVAINFSVEVDEHQVELYMQKRNLIQDETAREFIKSHMRASAVGCFEEALANEGLWTVVGIYK
jgi:hypothetical protein